MTDAGHQELLDEIERLRAEAKAQYDRGYYDGCTHPLEQSTAAEWQAGYEAGVEAAAKALKADAKLCDCSAYEAGECACGAWCEWKSTPSARAVEIVRELVDKP